jgi:hypothetical protein
VTPKDFKRWRLYYSVLDDGATQLLAVELHTDSARHVRVLACPLKLEPDELPAKTSRDIAMDTLTEEAKLILPPDIRKVLTTADGLAGIASADTLSEAVVSMVDTALHVAVFAMFDAVDMGAISAIAGMISEEIEWGREVQTVDLSDLPQSLMQDRTALETLDLFDADLQRRARRETASAGPLEEVDEPSTRRGLETHGGFSALW